MKQSLDCGENRLGRGFAETARRVDLQLRNDAVVQHHRETFCAHAHFGLRQIKGQPQSRRSRIIGIRQHQNFIRFVGFAPCMGYENIVGREESNAVILGRKFSRRIDKARQMARMACRGKCPGNSNNNPIAFGKFVCTYWGGFAVAHGEKGDRGKRLADKRLRVCCHDVKGS